MTGFPKPVRQRKVRRRVRRVRQQRERSAKTIVRQADRYCRFPLCACVGAGTAVCHLRHKGMGGNPTGDRSTPETMILLCHLRHREGHVALDKGNLVCVPLTAAGTRGPVAWEWKTTHMADWVEVARETAPHVFEPFTPYQRSVLRTLAEEHHV